MQDDRFEFPKIERPQVWLSFYLNSGGAWKDRDGKMKLPPGHSLASKFPDKVASAAEMKEREAKTGTKIPESTGKEDKSAKITDTPYVNPSVNDFNFNTKPVRSGQNVKDSDYVYSDNLGFFVLKEPNRSGSFNYAVYRPGTTGATRIAQIGFNEPDKVREYVTKSINKAVDDYWDANRGTMSDFKRRSS